MDFKTIDLVLENCEVITIETKYLGFIYLGDFKSSICRNDKGGFIKSTVCSELAIEINRKLNETIDKQGLFNFGKVTHPIERLNKYTDITRIEINYIDGSKDYYYTHWHVDDEYDNRYQKSKLNNFGDLYIVISETKGIDDYFEDDFINDPECIEDNWKEYQDE